MLYSDFKEYKLTYLMIIIVKSHEMFEPASICSDTDIEF